MSILISRGEHRNRGREISKVMMLQESRINYLKSNLAGRNQQVSKCSQLITFTKAVLQLEELMNRWLKYSAADLQSSKTQYFLAPAWSSAHGENCPLIQHTFIVDETGLKEANQPFLPKLRNPLKTQIHVFFIKKSPLLGSATAHIENSQKSAQKQREGSRNYIYRAGSRRFWQWFCSATRVPPGGLRKK